MNIGYIKKQALQLSPNLRKIVGNAGWLMVDRIVRMGLGLVVGVWIARYLGPAQFGSFNFAISFVALFGTLATFGLDNITVREIVRFASDAPELLGTSLALKIGGSLIVPLFIIATIRLIQPDDAVAIFLVSLLSFGLLFQAFDTIDAYFQSQVQSKLTVWAKNSAFLIMAVARIILIKLKAPLWTFAAAQVIELALGAAGLVIAYRCFGGRLFDWRASKKRAVHLLTESWPVILSGMAIMIYMRVDMVMLKVMRGDNAVGIYAAATRVSEVWYFIPTAIVSSVAPSIIRSKENPSLYYLRIRQLFSLMTLVSVLIGSVVALFSHWIVHVLYSTAFDAAGAVLAVHIWASVFVFLGAAQGPWDVSENLLELGLFRTSLGAIINVLLNFVLIPRYSAMGAAIATVIAYAFSAVFANALSSRTRVIFFMQLKSFLPYTNEEWGRSSKSL